MFFKLKEHLLKRLLIATSLGLLANLCTMPAQAAQNQKKPTVQKSKHAVVKTHVRRAKIVKAAPVVPSFGQKAGLHATSDMLDLKHHGAAAFSNANKAIPDAGTMLRLLQYGGMTGLPLMFAVPFNESVPDTGLLNAWWEMVSSLTTTGATLYAPERLAPTLHLWRAQVGWMGGFFILVMAISVLAPLRIGGFEVFFAGRGAQAAGSSGAAMMMTSPERLSHPGERILRYTRILGPVYLGLTGLLWVLLLIAGDGPLVALCHAMSTLSTSGISPIAGPAMAQSGFAGEGLIFLFLCFALTRRFWPGGGELRVSEKLTRDPELLLAASIVLIVPAILSCAT